MTDLVTDAHQHVWDLSRAEYAWLGPELAPIDRSIGIDELLPSLRQTGVDGTVLVQAADNAEDTALMRDVAAAHREVVAVVGYLPLERPDEVAAQIEGFREDPLLVGVRNLIHNIPDPEWLLRPDVNESLGLLEQAGLTFDVVSVLPAHLALVPLLAERHPDLRMVIDHLSKPPIGLDDREPWWTLIARAAESPNVYAKVSGLYSATTDAAAWTPDSIRPHFEHALDVFGASRLMYGGDWPISVLAGGYERVWNGLNLLFQELDPPDRSRILSRTAEEFYSIDPGRLSALRGEPAE